MKLRAKDMLREFRVRRPLYIDFTDRLKTIIKDLLVLEAIEHVSVEGRVKGVGSLESKGVTCEGTRGTS